MLDWIDAELARLGRRRTGEPEEQRSTGWSHVLRVPVEDGAVWFKSVAEPLKHEVAVTQALASWCPDDVLGPLAADPERGCLLLPDGGPTARETGAPPWPEVLRRYGWMQRAVAPRAAVLLGLGAFDRRPETLPRSVQRAARAAARDGAAARRAGAVRGACLRLAPLADTIDHGDFHEGNVFADGRIFDWGDAAVAHPFCTAVIALQDEPESARDAFLEPWKELAARDELLAQLEDALWVGKIARALTWQEIVDRVGVSPEERDPVATWLLRFLGGEPA